MYDKYIIIHCAAKIMYIYFVSTFDIWNDFILLVQFLVIIEYIFKKIWFWWYHKRNCSFIFVSASTDIITFSKKSKCLSEMMFDLLALTPWAILLDYLSCKS